MEFAYFYEKEVDMFNFYRIPKLLFTDERFKNLSIEAKVLYGLMLDRMSLSAKNQWLDREKKVYIYFSLEDVMEHLTCKKNKAVDIMKELDAEKGVGLIERVRQGQGKPSWIYVKSFVEKPVQKLEKQTSEAKGEISEVDKTNLLKLDKSMSGSPFCGSLEGGKTNSNNTKYNNTDVSKTESNLILSGQAGEQKADVDEAAVYAEIMRENIALEELLRNNSSEQELIEGIFDLILETALYKGERIVITSNSYPAQLVKSKFLKLTYFHVTYVLDCMKRNTTKVRNIKKYLFPVKQGRVWVSQPGAGREPYEPCHRRSRLWTLWFKKKYCYVLSLYRGKSIHVLNDIGKCERDFCHVKKSMWLQEIT